MVLGITKTTHPDVHMKKSIYLKRSLKVIVSNGGSQLPIGYLTTALRNLEHLGFTFSEELMEQVKTLSVDEFISFYQELVSDLKVMVGAHVKFEPMYPNFPTQVMEMDEAELYMNALIHYFDKFFRFVTGEETKNRSLPTYEKEERFPLFQQVKPKVIKLGSDEDFYEMIRQLISANGSISASDKEDIAQVIEHTADTSLFLPESIPHKENMSFVVSTLLAHDKASVLDVAKYAKTATDVLRLACGLSEGDVSLATPTTFKKFKRAERRFLLGLLEKAPNLKEEMVRRNYKRRWVRLGEILHPSEYASRFPKANAAFEANRKSYKVETFNGKVENALLQGNVEGVVRLLSTRPGEFARRLDHVLRLTNKNERLAEFVLTHFQTSSVDVSTPVLLQVMAHFKQRNEHKDLRTFFPKGNVSKVVGIENSLPHIPQSLCVQVVKLCEDTLRARFSALPALGNVFLDTELKSHVVPFSQRSASKSLQTYVRGSYINLPSEGDTVRFYLWWKEPTLKTGDHWEDDVDVDLSATFYTDDWKYVEHVSYDNLCFEEPILERSEEDSDEDSVTEVTEVDTEPSYICVHSGDITSAPEGAAEFIDVDMKKARTHGIRYVVMSLHSYSEHRYKDLPECFGGWMLRDKPAEGEIFEPSTVQNKIDITADTENTIPVIIDLKERKVVWADLSLTSYPNYLNRTQDVQPAMVLIGKAITQLTKPTLYDLFRLHVEGRGQLVQSKEEADTLFSLDEGITPFDIEKIMADFIA